MKFIIGLLRSACCVCSRACRATRKTFIVLGYHIAIAPSFCYHLTTVHLSLLHDCIVNIRYFFLLTPDELLEAARQQRKDDPRVYIPIQTGTEVIYEEYYRTTLPEPGFVRVKFYTNLDGLYQDSPLWSDVPLGPAGELDLRVVGSKWHLQNCLAADPRRLMVFPTDTPGLLSGIAVRVLVDGQFWLYVIEQPTAGRLAIRKWRTSVLRHIRRLKQYCATVGHFPIVQWLRRCSSCVAFIAWCFVARYCMDQFHMRFEIDLEGALAALWGSNLLFSE